MLIPTEVLKFGKKLTGEKGRCAIDRVKIESNRAIACNGKVAAMLEWKDTDAGEYPAIKGMDVETGLEKPILIEQADLTDILKTVPKRTGKPLLEEHIALAVNGVAQFGVSNIKRQQVHNIQDTGADMQYPAIEQMIPPKSDNPVSLSIEYLQSMLQSMKDSGFDTITLHVKDGNSAVRAEGRVKNGESPLRYTGVIMPISPE